MGMQALQISEIIDIPRRTTKPPQKLHKLEHPALKDLQLASQIAVNKSIFTNKF